MPINPDKTDKPSCECHGEPAYWQKDPRYTGGGYWHCAVKHRESRRRYYHNLTGMAYLHLRLGTRRNNALYRRRKRKERDGAL